MKKFIILLVVAALSATVYGMTPINTGQVTAWTGTPTIALLATPNTATVNQGPANGVISETFTVLSGMNTKLDMIAIDIAGSGDGNNPYTLRLVNLGDQSGAGYKPATYAAGTDLWGGTCTWTYYGSGQTTYNLDFTGAEELTLTVGNTYAFELTGSTINTTMVWARGGNVYAYGSMYDGSATAGVRDYIPTGAPRTASMAVYLIPEPATIALLGLGLALLRKKR
jgi:hypothetical protein